MKPANEFERVPVVLLCGGKGVLLEEDGKRTNKGLVEVLGWPLFAWVLLHYTRHGATDFVLATGMQGGGFAKAVESILGGVAVLGEPGRYRVRLAGRDCSVRLFDTGDDASTGDRLLACSPWLVHADRFCLTYSDTLSDVDLTAQMRFHRDSGRVATLVAAQLPVRFRVLGIRQDETIVRAFSARPVIEAAPINGGYYIFERSVAGYLDGHNGPGVVLEREVLEQLARDGELNAHAHRGAWQHFDCERDLGPLVEVARRLDPFAA